MTLTVGMSIMNHLPNCPRIEVDYSHKPDRIDSIQDLITFYEGIPDEAWCRSTRQDHLGRRCALGHVYKAYHGSTYTDFVHPVLRHNESDIVLHNDRPCHTPKVHVIEYLRTLLPQPESTPTQAMVALAVVTAGS